MVVLKKLFTNFRSNMKYVAIILLLVSIISYVGVQVVVITGRLIDTLGNYNAFMKNMYLFAIMLFVQFLLNELLKISEKILSFKVTQHIKATLYEKLINIKYGVLSQWSSDDLFQMWNSDIDEVQKISIGSVTQFSIKIISAVIAIVQLSIISPLFAGISVVFYLVAIIPVHIIGKRSKLAAEELRKSEGAVNRSFFQCIDFIKLIKTYGKKQEMLRKFDEANEMYSKKQVNRLLMSNFFRMVAVILKAIAPAVIIIIGIYKVLHGEITVGDVVISTQLLPTIQAPIVEAGNFIIQMKSVIFKIERIYKFLELEEEDLVLNTDEEFENVDLQGDIIFKDVSIKVLDNTILSPTSFKIKYGEKIAIVGESGSGKTTIANLIIRLLEPNSGLITIKEKSIEEYAITEYRKNIMYVQSDVYILNASIMENLELLGGKPENIYSVAKEIGFHGDILNMENGYQTVLNSKGSNLSGGQRKKLGFIRGVSVPSSLYIFDEVTTGLDQESADTVINFITNKIQSTVLLITHELECAKLMDKIIVMKNGSILDIGTHEEVFDRCEYYQELQTNMER